MFESKSLHHLELERVRRYEECLEFIGLPTRTVVNMQFLRMLLLIPFQMWQQGMCVWEYLYTSLYCLVSLWSCRPEALAEPLPVRLKAG